MQQPLVGESRVPTLASIWNEYQLSKKLKPKTREDYQRLIYNQFGDWLFLPIDSITKSMVEDRHRSLSQRQTKWGNGEAQANLAMRVLRAQFNYAGYKYDELSMLAAANPVKRLSQVKAWNRIKRRQTIIKPHQMPLWFQTVGQLRNQVGRDFLFFTAFCGARKAEVAKLLVQDVDLDDLTVTFRDTKNGTDHTLPLSTQMELIARNRLATNPRGEKYLFPGSTPGNGHYLPNVGLSADTKLHEVVIRQSGIDFGIHDLRRLFVTTADDLEFQDSLIKRLVNHSLHDVTDGYKVKSVRRLRMPMQMIADELCKQANLVNFADFYTGSTVT